MLALNVLNKFLPNHVLFFFISGPPVRLRVLKNGEHDLKRAVTVVGPDLGNVSSALR